MRVYWVWGLAIQALSYLQGKTLQLILSSSGELVVKAFFNQKFGYWFYDRRHVLNFHTSIKHKYSER